MQVRAQDRLSGQVQRPLGPRTAWRSSAGSVARSLVLLASGRVHLPRERVGLRVHFTDGSSGRVYRETRLDGGLARHPCVLVVAFRLHAVRGRGHALFRAESLFNTPLFIGYPGFASKLWLTADEHGRYRGVYEWDRPEQAEYYARSLWRILEPVCVRGSIGYVVFPDLRRDDVLDGTGEFAAVGTGTAPPWALTERAS